MVFDAKKLAFCGIYCPQCSFAVAYESGKREHLLTMPEKYEKYKQAPLAEMGDCLGCKYENLCGDCNIKDCAIEKGIVACSDCNEFPCEMASSFWNDGVPHHLQALENLKTMNAIGKEKWFEEFKKNLECFCGERLSWYYKCPIHTAEKIR